MSDLLGTFCDLVIRSIFFLPEIVVRQQYLELENVRSLSFLVVDTMFWHPRQICDLFFCLVADTWVQGLLSVLYMCWDTCFLSYIAFVVSKQIHTRVRQE